MRIKLRRRPRFSLEKLLLFLAVLCISSYALLEFTSISVPMFTVVKWPLIYVGGLCLLSQLNLFFHSFLKKKYFYTLLILLMLCVFLILSGIVNRDNSTQISIMRSSIRTICFLVELFLLMIWTAEKGHGKFMINFLFRYVLLLVIATDFLLVTQLIKFTDGSREAYLVGAKFIVAYLHMELLMLWFLKNRDSINFRNLSKPLLVLAVILLIVVSVRVQCVTGVLGCLMMFLCYIGINRPTRNGLRLMNSPSFLIIMLGVCLIFPFVSNLIVSIPAVNYFVVNVLGKNENLTGRLEIFQIFSNRIQGHAMFGFGMGNANAAAKELFGYANAQNALLQWVLQAGVMTTAALILLMLSIFRQRSRIGNFKDTMPLVVLIYVYIVLGTVETTFSMTFWMWVALLFMMINERKPDTAVQKEEIKG